MEIMFIDGVILYKNPFMASQKLKIFEVLAGYERKIIMLIVGSQNFTILQ